MQQLAKLVNGDMLASGLWPALDGEAPPLWLDGENVIFRDGKIVKAYGYLGLATPGARITGMKSATINGAARNYVGAGNTAYKYTSGGGLVSIATFAASAGIFGFVPLQNEAVLITNGVDPVQLYNGASAAAITAPFTRTTGLFLYMQQAFAYNTSNGGQYVEWGPTNIFDNWTPTLTNNASNQIIYDLSGDIVTARKLGNGIGLYSNADAIMFSYIGGTAVYGVGLPLKGVSAISQYSVIGMGDRHFGMGLEHAFATDLNSYLQIDRPAMRAYLDRYADWDGAPNVYGWPDWNAQAARWSIPKLGGGTLGVGYHWDKGIWTRFNDNILCGEESGPYPYSFQGKSNRLLRLDKTQHDNDGAALTAYAQTKPLDLGNRKKFKRISNLVVDGTWSGTVYADLGYSDNPQDTPTWVQTNIPIASNIFPDQEAKQSEFVYLHLKVHDSGTGANWEINGAEVWGEYTADVN